MHTNTKHHHGNTHDIKIMQWTLKLQFETFGALAVNKQNCTNLVEEHCSRSYFSLFMSITSHTSTWLLRSGL